MIVTSHVAGHIFTGVFPHGQVVHSVFPENKFASQITGTFALIGILFP
jgi:hypothetical protein